MTDERARELLDLVREYLAEYHPDEDPYGEELTVAELIADLEGSLA